MHLDETHAQLFFAVIPAFIAALPPSPFRAPRAGANTEHDCHQLEDRDNMKRVNAMTVLRHEIQQLPSALTKDMAVCDLAEDTCSTADDTLEDLLVSLDDLIENEILDQYQEHQLSFPKLHALEALLRPYCREDDIDMLSTHIPDEILRWIKYPLEGAEAAQYRKIAHPVQLFNKNMTEIYASYLVNAEVGLVKVEATQVLYRPRGDSSEIRQRADSNVQQAQNLCETTKSLVKVFMNVPQPCNPPHTAHIHLSGFEDDKIDMLVSICGNAKSPRWHVVHWTNSSIPKHLRSHQKDVKCDSFCSTLQASRKAKTRLRIQIRRDGSWSSSAPEANDRIMKFATVPRKTLEQWLYREPSTQATEATLSRLRIKDKLQLALRIARSLLYLLGSPLLQEPWKAESIMIEDVVDELANRGLDIKPYVTGQLNPCLQEVETRQSEVARSSILHLGLLLWELFIEEKVVIAEEDREEEDDEDEIDSLYNALNRKEIISRARFIDKSCLDLVANCLKLYTEATVIDDDFRANLYCEIVEPLATSLENYSLATMPPTKPIQREVIKSVLHPPLWAENPTQHPFSITPGPRNEMVSSFKTDWYTIPAQVTPAQIPAASADATLLEAQGMINDSNSWLGRFDYMNTWLNSALEESTPTVATKNTNVVRVAVLDTGVDLDHDFFCGPGNRQDGRLENKWFDCLNKSDYPVDEDPGHHGTAMIALLLRLLPYAEVYVVRVAKDADGLSVAKENIAKAIRYVVKSWDVDIVSISLGFSDEVPSIRDAIRDVEIAKDDKVLFFAAANNVGLNVPEMFPAFLESVISVRGTLYNGTFDPQYDPQSWPHKRGTNYGTLGKDVSCGWTPGSLVKSGCSVATPIMVAIAATIIMFVACQERSVLFPDGARDLIRTRRGMLSVFDVMTEDQQGPKRYLAPWQLFGHDESQLNRKLSGIAHALNKLPRREPRRVFRQGEGTSCLC